MSRITRAKQGGFTLLQALIAMIFTCYVLMIVYQNLLTLWVGMNDSANAAESVSDARMALDTMCDHVRNGVSNASTTTGIANSVLHDDGKNTYTGPAILTYYSSSAGTAYVTYKLSGGNLVRSVTGGSNVTEAYGVSSLSFTYYKAATYETPWTACATPSAPTSAELPYVCGVTINAATTYNSVTTQLTTTVRLRNAPVKSSMSGL